LDTFLSQTLYAYLHGAGRNELQKLTEVAKNREKDALRGIKVIQGRRICHQSKRHMRLAISG